MCVSLLYFSLKPFVVIIYPVILNYAASSVHTMKNAQKIMSKHKKLPRGVSRVLARVLMEHIDESDRVDYLKDFSSLLSVGIRPRIKVTMKKYYAPGRKLQFCISLHYTNVVI